MKRAMDLMMATLSLLALAPVFVILSVILGCHFGLPIVSKSLRPGLQGRIFSLYEFRTLYDKGETSSKLSHNSNIIEKLVSFLRRSKLYKLPQLLNVLYGQMSFVGPPLSTREYLVSCDIEQVRRFHVKPGITGWAQIHDSIGLSNTEKDRLDVWYVDNKSLRLDLYILWVTIKKSINLKIMGNLGISWYKKLQEYAGKVSGDRNVGIRQNYRK